MASHVRFRLRKWESRRTWTVRALAALSLPLALLLFMYTSGHHAPAAAARVVTWLWIAALSAAILCAETAWRLRFRLDRIVEASIPRIRA